MAFFEAGIECSVADLLWMLLELLSGVSGGDWHHLQSQLRTIHDRIDVCYESLDNSDDQAWAWVTQARELAYDMDDCICFRRYYNNGGANPSLSGFLEWIRGLKDISHKLRDLEARFNALKQVRPRSIFDGEARAVPEPIDDPEPVHLVDTESLVGHHAAMGELARMVMDSGDKAERKIISIAGMAGSGKTTLAATVYLQVREQNRFQCRVFVSVGQKPDLRGTLKKMLSQLGDGLGGSEEIDQLVVGIGDLRRRRGRPYLIVVDDLWGWEHWQIIMRCFPENNLGSRIITTTRKCELAWKCSSGSSDYVYNIGLLSDVDSKQLFLKKLYATGHPCPQYWDDVSNKIVRRCGGLPLALVSVATILPHQPSRYAWEGLGSNLLSSSHMDGVKMILNMSYNDLPLHLKSCLLYLSIFPENYIVNVKRLMRLWTTERIISDTGCYVTENELAKTYLGELNRSARSVIVFGQASATPSLTCLPSFVRVLDLEGCNGLVCLDGLLNLRLLRYLSLRGTDVSELPATIGMRLRSLTIHCGLGCSMEFLGSLSDPPKNLEKFKMTAGRFASVPKWISELYHLSFVQLTVCKQGTEQLKILERFSVYCPRPWLSFSAGCMQRLTYLELKLCPCPVRETSVPSGIGNLQRIKEVSLCYTLLEERSPNIIMVVGAMRKAVTEHPNRIDLFINGTTQGYSAEAAEVKADSAAGTGTGTDAGNEDDIQIIDAELVTAAKEIQSTTEIEEIEIEA
ncbi:hypothetical protein PR202_gb13551 [Eleusine coracana subsp. coracana]|uniref:Uncharacterized protein n=1 Tax=Eleusine coracana subsp. coracana TaxID=191504 RepID=A0AAV5EQT7_ELECO|nr:hypothetical protein PR202_gb13551 [Eleusine coracana subsp. coracana]